MAIEKHMLQTHSLFEKAGEVFEGVAELKAKIAQLEDDNALLRRNNEELRSKNEGLLYALADAETDLAMATRWRKVSEELPEDDKKYLVLNEKGFIQCAYFSPILKCFQFPVTHWMPLPKAPEEYK